jgi:hypothetical protein
MNPTNLRCLRRLLAVAVVALLGAESSFASTFLLNPGVYTATPSSTFNDPPSTFPVSNLFDGINSTESVWAIQGYLGGNSQGRDEGWISVQLNETYLITDLRFAARKPSGNTDGIDSAQVWVSPTPFSVNVTSAASTNAFLATPTGTAPNLSIGPFATANDIDYSFGSTLIGKYLLARFRNTTDHDSDRNLGARTFVIGEVGTVPEPGSIALGVAGFATLLGFSLLHRARRSQTHCVHPPPTIASN